MLCVYSSVDFYKCLPICILLKLLMLLKKRGKIAKNKTYGLTNLMW